jgi:hypothetical protein
VVMQIIWERTALFLTTCLSSVKFMLVAQLVSPKCSSHKLICCEKCSFPHMRAISERFHIFGGMI